VIVRGSVAVSSRNAAGVEQRLRVLEGGDHFGELALLHDAPRSASVLTLAPCVFLTLQRGQFNALLEHVHTLRPTLEAVHASRQRIALLNPADDLSWQWVTTSRCIDDEIESAHCAWVYDGGGQPGPAHQV
jgi:CRP-like cAMP-binding protein